MKPDPVLIESLMADYNLTQRQAKYVTELAKTGNQTQSHKNAGYRGSTDDTHKAGGSRLITKGNVQMAYKSLLREHYPERAEDFHLSKQKVVEDLELVKAEALKNIQDGKAAGGAYNGYVRSCELQGKAVGLFNTVHHKHEHELAVVSTEALLEDIRATNPALAVMLGEQLGAIEGECKVVEDPHIEDGDNLK